MLCLAPKPPRKAGQWSFGGSSSKSALRFRRSLRGKRGKELRVEDPGGEGGSGRREESERPNKPDMKGADGGLRLEIREVNERRRGGSVGVRLVES